MKKYLLLTTILLCTLITFSQGDWNYMDIENDSVHQDLSRLDSLNNDYRVFFSGENHSFQKSNLKLEFKLLKYFHEKHKVNNLILEFGDVTGWLVNEYVLTGNEKLKKAVEIQFSDNFVDYFERIRKLNLTLEEKEKIKIIGIDLQRSFSIGFEMLNYLLPSDSVVPSDSILKHVELIKFLQGFNKNILERNTEIYSYYFRRNRSTYSNVKSFAELLGNYQKYKKDYVSYLGENFELFDRFMSKLKISKENYSIPDTQTPLHILYREDYMYKALTKLAGKDETQKFYGQFGRNHTYKNPFTDNYTYNFTSLVSKFNKYKENPLHDKVFSMGIYYTDINKRKGKEGLQINNGIIKEIKKLKKDSIVIYEIVPNGDLDSALQQNYNYIIINNGDSRNENSNYARYDESYYVTSFNFSYGRSFMNFSGVNNYFNTNDVHDYLDYFGFGIATLDNSFYADFQYSFFSNTGIDLSDTSSIKLSGFNIMANFGYDFLKSKKIDCILAGGLGYQQLNLTLKQKKLNPDYLGLDEVDYNLYNPAFILGVSGEIRVRLIEEFMALSIKGGYNFDISNPKWKYKKQFLDFKTNMSSFYGQVTLCFGDFY